MPGVPGMVPDVHEAPFTAGNAQNVISVGSLSNQNPLQLANAPHNQAGTNGFGTMQSNGFGATGMSNIPNMNSPMGMSNMSTSPGYPSNNMSNSMSGQQQQMMPMQGMGMSNADQ